MMRAIKPVVGSRRPATDIISEEIPEDSFALGLGLLALPFLLRSVQSTLIRAGRLPAQTIGFSGQRVI